MSGLIKCPHCRQNTDATIPQCLNCGKNINLDDEQITASFKKSINHERQADAQYYFRGIMVFVIFIFVAILIFSFSISAKPELDYKPAYPMVSPTDDSIDGYMLGDTINKGVIDSFGGALDDFSIPDDDVIDDVFEDIPGDKDKPTEDDDR